MLIGLGGYCFYISSLIINWFRYFFSHFLSSFFNHHYTLTKLILLSLFFFWAQHYSSLFLAHFAFISLLICPLGYLFYGIILLF